MLKCWRVRVSPNRYDITAKKVDPVGAGFAGTGISRPEILELFYISNMHTHSPDHRTEEQRVFWAMVLTGSFMVAEFIGGLISGSLALIADSAHMLTDTASLALAWVAMRIANRPADRLRSYGYHRFQILAAFINGVAFMVMVVWIAIEAIQRLFNPVEVLGGTMMVIALVGLAVNILAFFILHSSHSENLNIQGAIVHVLGDLLGSVAAISAAGVILWTGWMPIDPLLSVFVALLILRSAWVVVKRSSHILLEGVPEDVDVKLIKTALVDTIPEVQDVHHVHVWSLTPERPLLTMHVNVSDNTDTNEVLSAVKKVLSTRFGIDHSTIQIESGQCSDVHIT